MECIYLVLLAYLKVMGRSRWNVSTSCYWHTYWSEGDLGGPCQPCVTGILTGPAVSLLLCSCGGDGNGDGGGDGDGDRGGGGDGDVAQPVERRIRHNADAGSTSRRGKGFFFSLPKSTLRAADPINGVLTDLVCNRTR